MRSIAQVVSALYEIFEEEGAAFGIAHGHALIKGDKVASHCTTSGVIFFHFVHASLKRSQAGINFVADRAPLKV